MTEIATEERKLYLATVIDLFSRRLLGYAMSAHHDTDLVVAALNSAAATRSGDVRGVIFHSDRGSEGGFNGSSQHLIVEVLHGKTSGIGDDVDEASGDVFAGAASGPSGCGAGVSGEDRRGLTSDDAAIACGVSGPVGSRWFRGRGGMPSIQLSPPRAGTTVVRRA
ncbi:DDE-type integrase/transposase/recombinase [Streptomyces sp. NBC_01696]|uniref:DDE-type integrase/transposase/recombinase n=1 Tax=Streptomyces sp. NBC_01696 TaxID=2975913 RepID=UPI002E37E720|nr:DDE-type integrase/transposase/recombinase [Streptomyces sp. NBC_01696]